MVLFGLTAMACGFLNPAGARLDEAVAAQGRGETEAAVVAYQSIVAEWPDSPEAATAKAALPTLEVGLLRSEIERKEYLGAARRAVSLEAAANAADTLAGRTLAESDSPEFAGALAWIHSESGSNNDRATTALSVRESFTFLQPETDPWLAAHIGEVQRPSCIEPLNTLADTTDMEALDTLEAECKLIVDFAPDTDDGRVAQRGITEDIPARREAIKRSPAYRTEAALQECMEYKSWVLELRRHAQSLARSGRNPQTYLDQKMPELERRFAAVQKTFDYLRGRLDSMTDDSARFELLRRIKQCEV